MFRMSNDTIIQETEKVIAKASVIAFDERAKKEVHLTFFCELTSDEQDVKPIAERALRYLGYSYLGIDYVDTTSVPFDAEGMYLAGKDKEQADLLRK